MMGEKAGATLDPTRIFTDDYGHMVNVEPDWMPRADFGTMFEAKMRNFVDHALYDKPSNAPGEHGLMVQKMLDGIYESAEKGKEVTIR